MIAVEPFIATKHYDTVAEWWKGQKWPVLPLSHLPANGLLVTSDGVPAAVGWIYKTDSAFCLFEWIVANPEIRHEKRAAAMSALIMTAKFTAKSMGFETIFLSIENQSLATRLEANGFKAEGAGTNYLCHI